MAGSGSFMRYLTRSVTNRVGNNRPTSSETNYFYMTPPTMEWRAAPTLELISDVGGHGSGEVGDVAEGGVGEGVEADVVDGAEARVRAGVGAEVDGLQRRPDHAEHGVPERRRRRRGGERRDERVAHPVVGVVGEAVDDDGAAAAAARRLLDGAQGGVVAALGDHASNVVDLAIVVDVIIVFFSGDVEMTRDQRLFSTTFGEDDTCENKDWHVGAGRKATTVGEDVACENKAGLPRRCWEKGMSN
uniref:Uncharacterized protein n=1 Tax=Oryza nivara TaxID=4536 RepID=A0A0E0HK96_ORYNI